MLHARYTPKRHGISGCSVARLDEAEEFADIWDDGDDPEVLTAPPLPERSGPTPAFVRMPNWRPISA